MTSRGKFPRGVCLDDDPVSSLWRVFEFDWGVYALSASKAIFRARTYNCITYSVR